MLYQIRFELTTPAVDDRPVYITGNFCDWAIDLEATQLHPTGAGMYAVGLQLDEVLPETIEYKYYRGGEGSLELNDYGDVTPNRTVHREAGLVRDDVPFWQWEGKSVNHTYLPIERTLYFSYPGKTGERRVQVVLPYDYDDTDETYPVLYLNDGQNLVGEGEGYGSWQTELRLAQLATRRQHGVIIVAIDHAGEGRMGEYTVEAVKPELGEGRTYLDFVIDTVKPHIDAHFRTLPGPETTGMGGSSLGGLITVWAGLLRPDVFGRWLVFSPALWISPGVFKAAAKQPLRSSSRVYLYGGESESGQMVAHLKRLHDSLTCEADGCLHRQTAVDPDGRHEEGRWGVELPRAIGWLFFNDLERTAETQQHEEAVMGEV